VINSLSGIKVVIAQLFPERLNLYGDAGNVATLTRRAAWRGADVEVRMIGTDASAAEFEDVDVIIAGGGPDADQFAVARGLDLLGGAVTEAIQRGASLLAVCGAFQNLGCFYETSNGEHLPGPGLLDVTTVAPGHGGRIVGGVVGAIEPDSAIALAGRESAQAAGFAGQELSIVGFENHAGRTFLGAGIKPLSVVRHGQGNNGEDRTEGLMALPGEGGRAGLRIASYLHGPLLPANPHVADALLGTALASRQVTSLGLLDDREEWRAHADNVKRWGGNHAT
jgi:CobQ-like glutamine amidotransferase family enzyme